jgi:hypothetical protein
MISHRITIIALNACILFGHCVAEAQDRTPAFELAHPDTGESGVWTPEWLQKDFLLTEVKLQACRKDTTNVEGQLTERTGELSEVRAANVDLKVGLESLKQDSAAQRVRADEAEDTSGNRLVWAATSTGAAAVAILLVILEAL